MNNPNRRIRKFGHAPSRSSSGAVAAAVLGLLSCALPGCEAAETGAPADEESEEVSSEEDAGPPDRDRETPERAPDSTPENSPSAEPDDDASPESPDDEEPSTPDSMEPRGPDSSPDEPSLPVSTCGTELPAAFLQLCSGCHTPAGTANERYPDLFRFSGSASDFVSQVRSGGEGMLSFDASAISDAEVEQVYAYFGTGERGAGAVDLGEIAPLFTASDPSAPPIVFQRDDGVLITRGAGRVRQRHELEGTFNSYGSHYFEDRSHGFLIEDHTTAGESLIRVYYLPTGMPTEGTNFRAWKIYGEGNVFYSNMGVSSGSLPSLDNEVFEMPGDYDSAIAPFATVQVQEVTRNPRTDAAIVEGDEFEFEFGVFLEPSAIREGTRTSYYSDTFRYRVGHGGLTPNNADSSGLPGPSFRAAQGGEGTNVWLYEDEEFVFDQMALNTQHENLQSFLRGRRLFHTDFETGQHSEPGNPEFSEHMGKMGPRFVTSSCEACHIHNGPGAVLEEFDTRTSMAFKLYDSEALGSQLQLQEGDARVASWETHEVELADGQRVELRRPVIEVTDQQGEPLLHSARLARKLIGLGLLEAIDEASIVARADRLDCDGDGISGRPLFVQHPETHALMLGRFGWKAEKISVRHQVLDALRGDLGVGSEMFPDAEGRVEITEDEVQELTAYMRLLSVPAQRGIDEPVVAEGEALFRRIGCAQCHVPDATTGQSHPFVELRAQAIKPYTDLLLHDMGPGLADASAIREPTDELAPPAASEWRTPPLWGLGLHATVNGNTGLLHDGRAQGVLEAILWHGGEATAVRDRVVEMSSSERAALIAFVESL